MLEKEFYSPAEVARALGVGVTTIKRWVDSNLLPAHKTAGGHRKILKADVVRLARESNLPFRGFEPPSELPDETQHNWSYLAEELFVALRSGDSRTMRSLIHGTHAAGVSIEVLGDRIIGPAMGAIGHEWESGRIDVMHEHRGTQLCKEVLAELKTNLEATAVRDRPIAVGGNPEGDHSELASLLIQMMLIDAGWEAVNLGSHTPMASFRLALEELRPKLLWISVTYPCEIPSFFEDLHDLQRLGKGLGASIAVGGRATQGWSEEQSGTLFVGKKLGDLAQFASQLHSLPQSPRRGRPHVSNRQDRSTNS